MPTHAELAAKLLKDAATFFRTLADNNEPLRKQMNDNATIFEKVAEALMAGPQGSYDGMPTATLAGRLLKDAAGFFRDVAEKNKPIKEQMLQNANVFEQMGDLVIESPLGILE